ncbi:DUF2946 family protein [Phreatobacter stygius]|nr:DUF2946 family protein [Phreatobacter stygius]
MLVAVLAYVIAATGFLGAINRTAHALEANQAGLVIICTMDGMSLVPGDGPDGGKQVHQFQHCVLCATAVPASVAIADAMVTDVAEPVAARAPARSYDPILPAYAFIGWTGSRPPRAPPVVA